MKFWDGEILWEIVQKFDYKMKESLAYVNVSIISTVTSQKVQKYLHFINKRVLISIFGFAHYMMTVVNVKRTPLKQQKSLIALNLRCGVFLQYLSLLQLIQ